MSGRGSVCKSVPLFARKIILIKPVSSDGWRWLADSTGVSLMQRQATGVQLAYSSSSGAWTLLGVDLAAALAARGHDFYLTRGLRLCSAMRVRGAFTSDIVYSLKVGAKQVAAGRLASWLRRLLSTHEEQARLSMPAMSELLLQLKLKGAHG